MSLRVLVYCDDPDNGGAAISTHQLALGLADRGFVVEYAQSRVDERRVKEREAAGIRHHFIPYQTMQNYFLSTQDRRTAGEIFRASMPDVVVFADSAPDSTLAAKELAGGLDIPYLTVKHMVLPNNPWTLAPTVRARIGATCTRARKVVLVSNATRDLLCQDFAVDPDHCTVIPNGRPAAFFAPRSQAARNRVRRELAIADDAFVVMTVAAMSKLKGFDVLRQVVRQMVVRHRIANTVFVWIGEGEDDYVAALKQEISDIGAAAYVRFAGRRADIPDCLDAADAFVLASQSESCPLSLIEAMAKGLPAVATNVGGIPEILQGCGPLVTSPLVDDGRAAGEIAEVLEHLREDPAARATLAAACARRAAERYDTERFTDSYAALIEDAAFAPGDYISPGLKRIKPDGRFPRLVALDLERLRVSGARRDCPHNRYADGHDIYRLIPNRDEAILLYNLARRWTGRRGLLLGADIGWTAAHLALAGTRLDILDPRLDQPDIRNRIAGSLSGLPVRLADGWDEHAVVNAATLEAEPWAFVVFNLPAPDDALGAMATAWLRRAAPDRVMVCWNVLASNTYALIRPMTDLGWRTTIYDTAQMIVVIDRNDTPPLVHIPDPGFDWQRPENLPE